MKPTWNAKWRQGDDDIESIDDWVRGPFCQGPGTFVLINFFLVLWISVVLSHQCPSIIYVLGHDHTMSSVGATQVMPASIMISL